mmetsp:Transcript_25631/g.40917  ORF Transcript_25631/g.40917 Transcript_25631/m.40917 type:complete len:83 (+) Transcript_25631:411-659(+)
MMVSCIMTPCSMINSKIIGDDVYKNNALAFNNLYKIITNKDMIKLIKTGLNRNTLQNTTNTRGKIKRYSKGGSLLSTCHSDR